MLNVLSSSIYKWWLTDRHLFCVHVTFIETQRCWRLLDFTTGLKPPSTNGYRLCTRNPSTGFAKRWKWTRQVGVKTRKNTESLWLDCTTTSKSHVNMVCIYIMTLESYRLHFLQCEKSIVFFLKGHKYLTSICASRVYIQCLSAHLCDCVCSWWSL